MRLGLVGAPTGSDLGDLPVCQSASLPLIISFAGLVGNDSRFYCPGAMELGTSSVTAGGLDSTVASNPPGLSVCGHVSTTSTYSMSSQLFACWYHDPSTLDSSSMVSHAGHTMHDFIPRSAKRARSAPLRLRAAD